MKFLSKVLAEMYRPHKFPKGTKVQTLPGATSKFGRPPRESYTGIVKDHGWNGFGNESVDYYLVPDDENKFKPGWILEEFLKKV